MFIGIGRFRFRPMRKKQALIQRMEQDVPPIAKRSVGFQGVSFVALSDDEVMTVWTWDSEGEREAGLAPVRGAPPGIRRA